jgi:hypothetical protein
MKIRTRVPTEVINGPHFFQDDAITQEIFECAETLAYSWLKQRWVD